MVYLSHEVSLAMPRTIANCAAPGSALVFTFQGERLQGTNARAVDTHVATALRTAGAQWVSGINPCGSERIFALTDGSSAKT